MLSKEVAVCTCAIAVVIFGLWQKEVKKMESIRWYSFYFDVVGLDPFVFVAPGTTHFAKLYYLWQ